VLPHFLLDVFDYGIARWTVYIAQQAPQRHAHHIAMVEARAQGVIVAELQPQVVA
jgi:hypothetical protein